MHTPIWQGTPNMTCNLCPNPQITWCVLPVVLLLSGQIHVLEISFQQVSGHWNAQNFMDLIHHRYSLNIPTPFQLIPPYILIRIYPNSSKSKTFDMHGYTSHLTVTFLHGYKIITKSLHVRAVILVLGSTLIIGNCRLSDAHAHNRVSQYPVDDLELHWIAWDSTVVSSEPIQFTHSLNKFTLLKMVCCRTH